MMEKVVITKCEQIFGGKAHGCTFADGRQATAWNDKVDSGILMQAFASKEEIEVELKPYNSKGKTGFNIIAVKSSNTTMTSEAPVLQTDADINKEYGIGDSSEKNKSIVAQCLTKCFCRNKTSLTKEQVLEKYNFFLENL